MEQKMKKISNWFLILAILLSNVMSAVVTNLYSDLQWGGTYAGYSTSPNVAFYLTIPYLIGISISIGIAIALKRKGR